MTDVLCDRGSTHTALNSECSNSHLNSVLASAKSSLSTESESPMSSKDIQMNDTIGDRFRPNAGSIREKVECYNNNIIKNSRVGNGLSRPRINVNERNLPNGRSNDIFSSMQNANYQLYLNPDMLCRSNSSLELLNEQNSIRSDTVPMGNLHREYGSHGSIDVISSPSAATSESFFAMLQDYRPAVLGEIGTDQRSPGPAEFLKGKINQSMTQANEKMITNQRNITNTITSYERSADPKLRNKLYRLWAPALNYHLGPSCKNLARENNISSEDNSLSSSISGSICSSYAVKHNQTVQSASTSSADIEERQRRRAFAHFDCQSLTANLGYAAKLRGMLLARRRNTTTGASAASMVNSRSTTPDADSGDEDYGDGHCNDLLENCPFFRNEIGGEEERIVSLTGLKVCNNNTRAIHRPSAAYGIAILECPPEETLWTHTNCIFQKCELPIESVDYGASYYKKHFYGQEHQNWFGIDEQLGPVAISIMREKLTEISYNNTQLQQQQHGQHLQIPHYQFRIIIRTSELLTLRGSIIEEFVPNHRGVGKSVTTKDVLEYVAPEIQLSCLRLGINTPQCKQQIMKLDEQGLMNKYKVGILYCRAGQSSEEDMYNNEDGGPAFVEFLETIGKQVRLKGFENYKGGLDNKTDSTGTHSLYAAYRDCEIMFHVSTMLPFTQNNRQQLLRKRHIGNDIVTIVFQEKGALPFTPRSIRSQFQHVFIIIRVLNPCSDNTSYRVAVSRSKDVPVFGPPIPAGATFPRNKAFADFLLAKIINAENAAHRSDKFLTMATRTRQEYLKDLTANYCTTTTLDQGTKFSIFVSKRKDKPKIRFSGDSLQRGAFCWQVVLQDSGLSAAVDCFLGISVETFVLIEECTKQIVFVSPNKSILGWSTTGNSLRIYHHQGECVTINMRDFGERDEQLEVIERLRAVTTGCGALELNLKRNPMGQLGFHVQPDGVVTQVETSGQAWAAGLRQGYRLVEICKIAVATLSHDQMVDLLKTSSQVTVTVIESYTDLTPRRGCFSQNCKLSAFNFENDHEKNNIRLIDHKTYMSTELPAKPITIKPSNAELQQPVANQRRRYERNFSPPRSSNSSGYGTGSSSRSFSLPAEQQCKKLSDMGAALTSSCYVTNEERLHSITGDTIFDQNNQFKHNKLPVSNLMTTSLPICNSNLQAHSTSRLTSTESVHKQRDSNSDLKNFCSKNFNVAQDSVVKADDGRFNNDYICENSTENNSDLKEDHSQNPLMLLSALKIKNTNGITAAEAASPSRNNIPRLACNASASSVTSKLRPGVTGRTQSHLMQRNSANYFNNTFQEELIKLINPDYLTIDDSIVMAKNVMKVAASNSKNVENSHSLVNLPAATSFDPKASKTINEMFVLDKKCGSREAINLGQQYIPDLKGPPECEDAPEVIYTTAKPATVISHITNEGRKPVEENILHISEGTTPFKRPNPVSKKRSERQVTSAPPPFFPDSCDMNWSTLVDTATKAMIIQFHDEQKSETPQISQNVAFQHESNLKKNSGQQQQYSSDSSPHSSPGSKQVNGQQSPSITPKSVHSQSPEIQTHLNRLEDRIFRETRRRKSLELTVRRLTEENRRLQDESQAAVQQLRRFTEWFFQTIDRQ